MLYQEPKVGAEGWNVQSRDVGSWTLNGIWDGSSMVSWSVPAV